MNDPPRGTVDLERATKMLRGLLESFGLDPEHPSLAETPARAARALFDLVARGHGESAEDALGEGFPVSGRSSVVARGIPLLFACPHHLTPAFGEAHVAFVPHARVPGLSRIAKLVDVLSRRAMLQEDLGRCVIEELRTQFAVEAAVVVIEARHTCVALDDLARAGTIFRTRAFFGPDALVVSLDAEIGSRERHDPTAPR